MIGLSQQTFGMAKPAGGGLVFGGISEVNQITGVANTQTGANERYQAAALGNGNYVVVWSGSSTGNAKAVFRIIGADGNPIGSDTIVDSDTTTNSSPNPSVVAYDNGTKFWITYTQQPGGKLYIRRYNQDGSAIGSRFSPGNITTTGSGGVYHTATALLSNGNIVSAWFSYGSSGGYTDSLQYRIYDSSGSPITGAIYAKVANGYNTPHLLPLPDGRFWYLFSQSNSDSRAVIFNNDGSVHTNEFSLATGGNPRAAVLDDGNVVVAWGDINGPHFQILDADGTKIGGLVSIAPDNSPMRWCGVATGPENGFLFTNKDNTGWKTRHISQDGTINTVITHNTTVAYGPWIVRSLINDDNWLAVQDGSNGQAVLIQSDYVDPNAVSITGGQTYDFNDGVDDWRVHYWKYSDSNKNVEVIDGGEIEVLAIGSGTGSSLALQLGTVKHYNGGGGGEVINQTINAQPGIYTLTLTGRDGTTEGLGVVSRSGTYAYNNWQHYTWSGNGYSAGSRSGSYQGGGGGAGGRGQNANGSGPGKGGPGVATPTWSNQITGGWAGAGGDASSSGSTKQGTTYPSGNNYGKGSSSSNGLYMLRYKI